MTGQVIYVSADRLTDPPARSPTTWRASNSTPQALKEAGDLQLQAGMPAEVFIRTPERTPMQYLLEPVSGFMQRSFREP